MKLSYRDKVIFIVAIVAIILVAGFFLFIKPKFTEMNSAKSRLETKQSEKANVEAKIDTLPELVEQLKESAKEVEEIQSYFFNEYSEDRDDLTAPYENEQLIHELLNQSGVTVTSMNTSYTTGNSIIEYTVPATNVHSYDLLMKGDLYDELPEEVRNNYNGIASSSGSQIVIGVTTVTIGYTDVNALTNVFKFIDAVAADERTMTVLNVTGGEGAVGTTETDGQINLRLYSIFPLNVDKVMEESDTVEIVLTDETPAE